MRELGGVRLSAAIAVSRSGGGGLASRPLVDLRFRAGPLSGHGAQRLICGPTHPEAVQERGELAGHGDHRAFLCILPPSGREADPPAPQIGIGPKGAQDVLRPTDEQAAEHRIPAFGDPQLRVAPAGLVPPGAEAEIRAHGPALVEASGVLEGEDLTERGQQPDAAGLAQARGLGVLLLGQPL
jgi:hypothetical protein